MSRVRSSKTSKKADGGSRKRVRKPTTLIEYSSQTRSNPQGSISVLDKWYTSADGRKYFLVTLSIKPNGDEGEVLRVVPFDSLPFHPYSHLMYKL